MRLRVHQISMAAILIIMGLFSIFGCFQDPDDYIIYVNEYELNISDIDEVIFIDSIRVNVTAIDLDTSILFQNVEHTDLVQFNFEMSKNKNIQVEYTIYHDDAIIKDGVTEYLSGKFEENQKDSLDQFTLHQEVIDSIKVIILNSLKVGFTDSDTLKVSEFTQDSSIRVIIPLMVTNKRLLDSCEVKIEGRSAAIDDFTIDSLVVFPEGATIGEKITLDLDFIDDAIIEGTESFELSLRPVCASNGLYRGVNYKKVITIEDRDSVMIQQIPGDTNILESDSLYEFKYLIEFSEGADSLDFPIEVKVSPFTTLHSDDYDLSYNIVKLSRSTQDGDTLRIPVKLQRQNNIQESIYSEDLFINTSTDSTHLIQISSQAYIHLLNDDFSYYFISDTIAQKIIVLDHQFQYMGSRTISGKTIYDIDLHAPDTLRLSTPSESILWSIRDDQSEIQVNPLGYQIEHAYSEAEVGNNLTISFSEALSTTPVIEVTQAPLDPTPTIEFTEYLGTQAIWLKTNPFLQHVEAHYYHEDTHQIRIVEMTQDYALGITIDTLVELGVDWEGVSYTGGVGIDTLGNRFYSINSMEINELDTQRTAGIIQIDKDFQLTSLIDGDYLELNDWDNWNYKSPGPVILNLQGDLVSIDPDNSNIIKVDIAGQSILQSQSLPELTEQGTWSLFELRTESPISLTLD